jgi:hypothetical protein
MSIAVKRCDDNRRTLATETVIVIVMGINAFDDIADFAVDNHGGVELYTSSI